MRIPDSYRHMAATPQAEGTEMATSSAHRVERVAHSALVETRVAPDGHTYHARLPLHQFEFKTEDGDSILGDYDTETSKAKARAIFKASNRLPFPERIALYSNHASENGPFKKNEWSQFHSMSLGLFEHQIRRKILTRNSQTALKELHEILENKNISQDLRQDATDTLIEYLNQIKKTQVDSLKNVLKSSPGKILQIAQLLTYVKNQFMEAKKWLEASFNLLNDSSSSTTKNLKPLSAIISNLELLLRGLNGSTSKLIAALQDCELAVPIEKMLNLSAYSTYREEFTMAERKHFHAHALDLFNDHIVSKLDSLKPEKALAVFEAVLNEESISLELRGKVEQAARDYFIAVLDYDISLIEGDLKEDPLSIIDHGQALIADLEKDPLYKNGSALLEASYQKKETAETIGFLNEYEVLLSRRNKGSAFPTTFNAKIDLLRDAIRAKWLEVRETTSGWEAIQAKSQSDLPTLPMIQTLMRDLLWLDSNSPIEEVCKLVDKLGGTRTILQQCDQDSTMINLLKEFAVQALGKHYHQLNSPKINQNVLWNIVIAIGGKDAILATANHPEMEKYLDFVMNDGKRSDSTSPSSALIPPPSVSDFMKNRVPKKPTVYTPPKVLPPPPPPITIDSRQAEEKARRELILRLMSEERRMRDDGNDDHSENDISALNDLDDRQNESA